jgi:ribosome biogenesis protein ENP2
LGLDHLVGTPALKPYMHGYFLSLRLYDTARVIANPFVYAEHRENLIRQKMDKMAESRIRSKKDNASAKVKVNKALAEKIVKEEEKERKREARKLERRKKEREALGDQEEDEEEDDEDMGSDEEGEEEEEDEAKAGPSSLLADPRFAAVFEDPDYEVDTTSREYALLNPSAVAQMKNGKMKPTRYSDEDESDDEDMSDDLGPGNSDEDEDEADSMDSDSSEEGGELISFSPLRDQSNAPAKRTPVSKLHTEKNASRIGSRMLSLSQCKLTLARNSKIEALRLVNGSALLPSRLGLRVPRRAKHLLAVVPVLRLLISSMMVMSIWR